MRIEELAFVCQEAARDLATSGQRPLPPSVVLPTPKATRIVRLEEFPDDDDERRALLTQFAHDEMTHANAPAFGFIAEADGEGQDVVVVVYGATNNHPRITGAAIREAGALGDFGESEPLDPGALPFLAPLVHAVSHATAPPPTSADVLSELQRDLPT